MRIFTSGENPAFYHISQDSNWLRGSPTARKYSLLFGGAYAPNDAIYRKRYAFTDALIKLLVFFGRVVKNSYQLFFPRLPATSTKKAQTALAVICAFSFGQSGEDKNSLRALNLCSHLLLNFALLAFRLTHE